MTPYVVGNFSNLNPIHMIRNAGFYIAENGEQKGPFSIPELKEVAILIST